MAGCAPYLSQKDLQTDADGHQPLFTLINALWRAVEFSLYRWHRHGIALLRLTHVHPVGECH